METDPNLMVEQAIAGIKHQLIQGWPKDRRHEAQSLFDRLAVFEKMRTVTRDPVASNRFGQCKFAIEAIEIYLRELNRPIRIPEQLGEIKKAISSGGFRGGEKDTGAIGKSITMYTTGRGKDKGILKQIGDMVGLGSWDDSRFK